MSIEQAERPTGAPPRAPSAPPPTRTTGEPPLWLLIGLGAAYLAALAVMVFYPGATLLDRLRALDGGICAQAPTHSFFIASQQLPLCSRNTGIYLGFACTALVLLGSGRLRAALFPSRGVILALAVAFLFMAEDGLNSFFLDLGLPHPYQPFNPVRLVSGLGAGVAMAAFILPVANTLIWRAEDERPSFRGFGQLAVMLPVLLLAFLAVISQTDFLLYPIAILSSLGLALALTLVNVVFILGLTNRVGRFASWRQLFPFASIALVLAVLELMALFALKTMVMQALAPH